METLRHGTPRFYGNFPHESLRNFQLTSLCFSFLIYKIIGLHDVRAKFFLSGLKVQIPDYMSKSALIIGEIKRVKF